MPSGGTIYAIGRKDSSLVKIGYTQGPVSDLIDVLLRLDESAAGQVIAAALGVGTAPLTDLARRLTLQTRAIVQTGRVPG
jgi:hypothetical protein